MAEVIKIAKNTFGRIDILCQNAGIFPIKTLEEMSYDSILANFFLNIMAAKGDSTQRNRTLLI